MLSSTNSKEERVEEAAAEDGRHQVHAHRQQTNKEGKASLDPES